MLIFTPWTAFPSAWTSKGLEGLEAIRHGPQAWASPHSLHLLSASPLMFQALLMLIHCPNSPPSGLCRVKRDKNVGCAERCPGRWAPRMRSRLDTVDARVLTLSHFPGSLAIFCAVGGLPKRRLFCKMCHSVSLRTRLLFQAVLWSLGPKGREGVSGRASSLGPRAQWALLSLGLGLG